MVKGHHEESPSETIWGELLGRQVQIHRDGNLVRTGFVEDVTHAGDGLWLESRGIDHRALYAKAEGYSANALRAENKENA
ncbi:hypothetical protein LVY72_19710 [Arthrobacter sp. I2-34]|uniref:Uncharacterized protein n=1 Tax=Arthrobacter hankyongi TaxID=2904801 RepID=A0ABS9LBY8_9MICC|nr:hypothetical protein [Arthrobacter hankyongi]MCG2624118.1 hypothetical protein [Arthrobacter hankyongi]